MQNIKKLAVMVLALCVTMPLFAMQIKEHQPSREAQAWLEGKILNYLKQGQYKQIDQLIDSIPKCDSLKKTYKEGQVPAKCMTRDDGVVFVDIESTSQPGFIKKDGAAVVTMNYYLAIANALDKHFSYPSNAGKKAGYLDYNKFITFYNKARTSGAEHLRDAATTFIEQKFKDSDKPENRFDLMAIAAKSSPEESFWYSKFPFEADVNSLYGQAKNIFNNDMATFQHIKWKLFLHGIKVGECVYGYFWEDFAIQPPFTSTTQKQKQKYVEDLIRKTYNNCRQKGYFGYSKYERCHFIKTYAQKYGFWKETAEEREHRVNAEMRGHIATQPKM